MAGSPPAAGAPALIVLDVNETLSDLSAMDAAFVDAGLAAHEVDAWFSGVLRDAFALTVLGDQPSFAEIAAAAAHARLTAAGAPEPRRAADDLMKRFVDLAPHADVAPGIEALGRCGCRVVTLSNGSASVARDLLADTPAADVVEQYLSVEDAGAWKPDPRAYTHALASTGVAATDAMLVAVHPWDIEGARRAGLRSAWINRDDRTYPAHLSRADVEASSLVDLAEQLAVD